VNCPGLKPLKILFDENHGYFVSRLKQNMNPVIMPELREWSGRAIPLEGKKLRAVLNDLDGRYTDVEVEVELKRAAKRSRVSR